MLRNNGAITPVLSNILLVIIAVAGMSIAITATYVITGNLHETMGERVIAEDVWFRTDIIAICLLNNGKTAIDVAAVYVENTPQSFTSLHVEPLDYGWINVTYGWTANTVYHINIVTSRGTQVADYYKSPT